MEMQHSKCGSRQFTQPPQTIFVTALHLRCALLQHFFEARGYSCLCLKVNVLHDFVKTMVCWFVTTVKLESLHVPLNTYSSV